MPETKRRERAGSKQESGMTMEERELVRKHKDKLSPSTLRAKWVHSPEEREDRKGQTLATRSHDVIKAWAEERGATPSTVEGTMRGTRPGSLRFAFNNEEPKGRLKEVSWDDWFRTFDERQLIFLHQQHLRNGNQSNFFRFDSPNREDA